MDFWALLYNPYFLSITNFHKITQKTIRKKYTHQKKGKKNMLFLNHNTFSRKGMAFYLFYGEYFFEGYFLMNKRLLFPNHKTTHILCSGKQATFSL